MKKYFENPEIAQDEKRDMAFQTLVASRDMLNLAIEQSIPVTYEQTLNIIHDLSPELYDSISSLLLHKNENDELKFYIEMANLESKIQSRKITPESLIDNDIKKYKYILDNGLSIPDDYSEAEVKNKIKYINKKIATLTAAKLSLEPRRLSENRIIFRDYDKIDRSAYFAERLYSNDDFVDYKLNNKRNLRIRLLHPDLAEHITGADLIYEQIDFKKNRVRFVFLQYKTWDDNGVIYFSSSKSILQQIEKMQNIICRSGFCQCSKTESTEHFRFPYCSAFLRPTDKIQHEDSKMISSGFYVPVCDVLKISQTENKLEKKKIKKNSVTHKIFEDLFNQNLIGSDWLSFAECEEFYINSKIMRHGDRIRIMAREFIEADSMVG